MQNLCIGVPIARSRRYTGIPYPHRAPMEKKKRSAAKDKEYLLTVVDKDLKALLTQAVKDKPDNFTEWVVRTLSPEHQSPPPPPPKSSIHDTLKMIYVYTAGIDRKQDFVIYT